MSSRNLSAMAKVVDEFHSFNSPLKPTISSYLQDYKQPRRPQTVTNEHHINHNRLSQYPQHPSPKAPTLRNLSHHRAYLAAQRRILHKKSRSNVRFDSVCDLHVQFFHPHLMQIGFKDSFSGTDWLSLLYFSQAIWIAGVFWLFRCRFSCI